MVFSLSFLLVFLQTKMYPKSSNRKHFIASFLFDVIVMLKVLMRSGHGAEWVYEQLQIQVAEVEDRDFFGVLLVNSTGEKGIKERRKRTI